MNSKPLFLAPGSRILGKTSFGKGASVWFNAVIRTEGHKITIGSNSNIQDNCTIHGESDIKIGKNVTVGHNAVVHCKKIGDNSLIGMGAILLEGAEIGKNCIVGAGTLVKEGVKVPDNCVFVGVPGKVIRKTTKEDIKLIEKNAEKYALMAAEYAAKAK